jgi:hypothetical protein
LAGWEALRLWVEKTPIELKVIEHIVDRQEIDGAP